MPVSTASRKTPAGRRPRADRAKGELAETPVGGTPQPDQRVLQLRGILFDSIEREVRDGNVRVILWLADRLRLLDVADAEQSPSAELRTMLEDLQPNELREFADLAGTA